MALVKAGGYNSDRPLPWEPPYAAGTTLEKAQKTKKQKKKLVVFLYTNNEISERKCKQTVPFKMASKKLKHLGRNLVNELKDICLEA